MKRLSDCLYVSLLCVALAFTSCSSWEEPAGVSEQIPAIFPDYADVTVPCNIAPLNFMVEGAGKIQAVLMLEGSELMRASGKEGVIEFPMKKWQTVLSEAKGRDLAVLVSLWSPEYPEGMSYSPFYIHVAEEQIDGWVAYRLIEPGYVGWRQLGLYQRELSSFHESAIITNRKTTTTCLNCHEFPSYSPESMMFHARGANGGTIVYDEGKLQKIDFTTIGLKKNVTYPSWHPQGRYIAFSANFTRQIFYVEGRQQVEVFDTSSDLLVYDVKTGEAVTDPRFATPESLETFPTWSPDGKYLYFASHSADSVVTTFFPDMQYDLLRVAFDAESKTFGQEVDTLYNARVMGGSVSHPRVSPDGRYLVYTLSDYGTFPIRHDEADLKMLDLETMEHVDISMWNDPESADSYHVWSSNGRWMVFGSRRLDGRYTRLFIAYLDKEGRPCKPFLLPQEDPRHNVWRLRSYNKPELINGKVSLPRNAEDMFVEE